MYITNDDDVRILFYCIIVHNPVVPILYRVFRKITFKVDLNCVFYYVLVIVIIIYIYITTSLRC